MPGRMKSVDPHHFAMVPRPDIPRSAFDVQHGHKTTFNAGPLVPIYVDEILPGDSFVVRLDGFVRLSTPIVPMMDNLEFESFFFFVPNRLVWSNWERFMGEQANPSDSTVFLTPYVNVVNADCAPTFLADYMGLTVNGSANTLKVLAFPFRAYNLIWNDWFRDEDLDTPVAVPVDDGPDTLNGTYALLTRRKRHDYFTSARPWPHKPYNIDLLPNTSTYAVPGVVNSGFRGYAKGPYAAEGIGAPIVGLGVDVSATDQGAANIYQPGSRVGVYSEHFSSGASAFLMRTSAGSDYPDVRVLVQDIRTATMVQEMLERNARGGTRYAEIVRSHFGVISPDARLQRPEYLGGGRTMIQVNPVAQTSASGATGTTTKLGELAGVGTGMISGHGFSRSFTEHGTMIGLINVRSYLTYQQGVERMWSRRTQFDYYWPGLAHLGEQNIQSQEVYADGSSADVNVFGYQERWSEYKYKPSRTSGYFRSTVATPLDMWHLGEKFTSRPVLNSAFVQDLPPVSRVLQVATNFGEDFLGDFLLNIRRVRPMPMYSIPGLGSRL